MPVTKTRRKRTRAKYSPLIHPLHRLFKRSLHITWPHQNIEQSFMQCCLHIRPVSAIHTLIYCLINKLALPPSLPLPISPRKCSLALEVIIRKCTTTTTAAALAPSLAASPDRSHKKWKRRRQRRMEIFRSRRGWSATCLPS